MGLKMVDNTMKTPELLKDQFFDEVLVSLLYSEESSQISNYHYHGSTSEVHLEQKCSSVRMIPHSQSEYTLKHMRKQTLSRSVLPDVNENERWKIPTSLEKF